AVVGASDVLVTTRSINVRKPIVAYTDAELDRVVDLNLKGTFRLCRTFGALMAKAGRGSMIGFTSIRSQTTEPGQGAYAATKAGTVMLFKTLAVELGPRGVRANTVAPGVVETPLTQPIKDKTEWYDAYAAKAVLKRWGPAGGVGGPRGVPGAGRAAVRPRPAAVRRRRLAGGRRPLRAAGLGDAVPIDRHELIAFTQELVRVPSVHDPATGRREEP